MDIKLYLFFDDLEIIISIKISTAFIRGKRWADRLRNKVIYEKKVQNS